MPLDILKKVFKYGFTFFICIICIAYGIAFLFKESKQCVDLASLSVIFSNLFFTYMGIIITNGLNPKIQKLYCNSAYTQKQLFAKNTVSILFSKLSFMLVVLIIADIVISDISLIYKCLFCLLFLIVLLSFSILLSLLMVYAYKNNKMRQITAIFVFPAVLIPYSNFLLSKCQNFIYYYIVVQIVVAVCLSVVYYIKLSKRV